MELSLCHKLKFSHPHIFETYSYSLRTFNSLYYLISQNSWFKISWVYVIGMQRYREEKIRICDKD